MTTGSMTLSRVPNTSRARVLPVDIGIHLGRGQGQACVLTASQAMVGDMPRIWALAYERESADLGARIIGDFADSDLDSLCLAPADMEEVHWVIVLPTLAYELLKPKPATLINAGLRAVCPVCADMEEVHVVMVLPSWEALGRMKADEVDLAADDDDAEGVCTYTMLRAGMLAAQKPAKHTPVSFLKMLPPKGRPCSPLCWRC